VNTLLRFWFGDEREGGQANVLLVIVLLGMIMMVGLAIDAGQLFVARRHMQEAADAAAFAGAVSLYRTDRMRSSRPPPARMPPPTDTPTA